MEELISEAAARVSVLLQRRFPRDVGAVVCDIDGNDILLPEEEPYVARAVASRRAEFAAGRWCARRALQSIGCDPSPIPVGALREPLWPEGFVGSITHSAGLAAAVAAPGQIYRGIGVDLCDVAATSSVLASASGLVTNDEEVVAARLALGTAVDANVVLFSAKESVAKVVSSSVGRFLEFTEVKVGLQGDRFTASVADLDYEIRGWWEPSHGLLLTGAYLKR